MSHYKEMNTQGNHKVKCEIGQKTITLKEIGKTQSGGNYAFLILSLVRLANQTNMRCG